MKVTRRQLRQIIAEAIILEEEWSAKDDIKSLRNAIDNLEAKVKFLLKNLPDPVKALKGKT